MSVKRPMVKMANLTDYLPENVYNIFKMPTKIEKGRC
jgi:hypothetical protein